MEDRLEMTTLNELNIDLIKTKPKSYWIKNKIIPIDGKWLCSNDVEISRNFIHFNFNSSFALVDKVSKGELTEVVESAFKEENSDSVLQEIFKERNLIESNDEDNVSGAVIRLANNLIAKAIEEQATDIHFEPEENQMRVRLRIDGILTNLQDLPNWVMAPIISRIKIMGNLDISEKRLPQDGRIQWKDSLGNVDIRLSSLPTRFGEKLVLRILRSNVKLDSLDDLHLPKAIYEKIQNCFKQPQGILYVTGPTGSGKSSTLFAGLKSLSDPTINITTIEDPIEYHLDGANQVQINEKSGLTFSKSLRSILRQDPDVILVGETRDLETAQISIQAAQTGHLVLTTLHTNDSISAIDRLRDLGIAPYLISSSLLGVIAQRLVRKLCKECSEEFEVDQNYQEQFPQFKMELGQKIFKACGCKTCHQSGYEGRIALFEFLELNDELKSKIHNEEELAAIKLNSSQWYSLNDDGINKINQGLTTPEEVVRVLGI